jgi:hypothetical protein
MDPAKTAEAANGITITSTLPSGTYAVKDRLTAKKDDPENWLP